MWNFHGPFSAKIDWPMVIWVAVSVDGVPEV